MSTSTKNCEEIIAVSVFEILKNYTSNITEINGIIHDLNEKYSQENRYYHNTEHICRMLNAFDNQKDNIKQKNALFFAIIWHDIIYDPQKNDNEEQSAEYALRKLEKISYRNAETVAHWIWRTKNHFVREENEPIELQLLLDFDLETMGSEPEVYARNTRNIRKEYTFYSDEIFNLGRARILQQFLDSPSIYRTKKYYERFEDQARINISNELKSLI